MVDVSEAARVRAGMEIVSWAYKPAFWEAECVPQIEAELGRARRSSPAVGVVAAGSSSLATFALAVALDGSALLAASVAAGTFVVMGAAMLGGYLSTRHIALTDVELATENQRALFTSSGMLFGPIARLWRGDGYQLIHAGIERSGTTLRLVFTPSFGPITRLDVPVPVEFEKELPELVRLLEIKTPRGRATAPEPGLSPRQR